MRRVQFCFLLLLVTLGTSSVRVHGADHSGDVSGTWTKAESPHYVVGDVRVPPDETLTIEAGCEVFFAGYYKFVVDERAVLLAQGTSTDWIVFDVTSPAVYWHGIRFEEASDSSALAYCRFTHGRADGGGEDSDGGAIYCHGSDLSIEFCTFQSNAAVDDGGAISCWAASPRIADSLFFCNSADSNGGAIYCGAPSSPLITGNRFLFNLSNGGAGGAIHCYNSDSQIIGNVFESCYSYRDGGAIWCGSSDLLIANNIFTNNDADYGGAIHFASSGPGAFCVGNSICGNSARSSGGGIYCYVSNPTVKNTILWGNSPSEIGVDGVLSPDVTYCDVEGGWPGVGNIDDDPLFVDPVSGDFHLTWNSPCRDAGDASYVTEPDDFEGDPRICGPTVDMGADEYWYHLYVTGSPVPGGVITYKVVGVPGTDPVRIYRGSLQTTPQSTQYGLLYIKKPWKNIWSIGPVPADGVATTTKTIPSGVSPGAEFYFQALHGPLGDSSTKLTNLFTLTVE